MLLPPYDLGEMIAVNERGLAWLHFPRARVGTKPLESCVTSTRSAGHAPST